MNELANKKALVLGFAKTGYSTALYLLRKKASVIVSALDFSKEQEKVSFLKEKGVTFIEGKHPLSLLDSQIDFIVKNPGIPYTIPFLVEAKKQNIPIITEVELVSSSLPKTIAITGSNGKTTTTTLIHELLQYVSKKPVICGNIGRPITDVLNNETNISELVMELSSFQLQGTLNFKPSIALLLNLTPSHLDYHRNFEEYYQAKAKITRNQTSEDYLIYNAEDIFTSNIAKNSKATTIPFRTHSYHSVGASVQDGYIYYNGQIIMEEKEVFLKGKHNLENILSSLIVAKLMNVPNDSMVHLFQHFSGVAHRLQFIGEMDGRKFYNDSKATNIVATTNAVNSFEHNLILIVGGLDRGNNINDFLPILQKCKKVFLIGEIAPKLEKLAKEKQLSHVLNVHTLGNAFYSAYNFSEPGDTILLSPACASWDQFDSFESRGDCFINLLENIQKM